MGDLEEDDAGLDALFLAGQAQRPEPSSSFMKMLADDAEAAIPRPAQAPPRTEPMSVLAPLKRFFAASGLSGAAALGIWVGFIMPELVTDFAPFTDDVTMLSAFLPRSDLSVLND